MNENLLQEDVFFWTNKKIIPIFSVITDETVSQVIKALYKIHFQYEQEFTPIPKRKVVLLINSPGGVVSAGMSIYDTLKILPLTVYTVCVGLAASMGAFLLSSGTKGKRYALSNSEIMIHQPLGGAQGQASDIKIQADHIIKTKQRLNNILASNTGLPLKKIQRATDRDNYLTPEEAIEYGLIDSVITKENFKEVFSNENI